MGRYALMNPAYDKETVPELWHMYARSGTLFFNFSPLCWKFLQELELRFPFMKPSTQGAWGFENVLAPARIRKNGWYTVILPVADQVNDKKRNHIADSLAFLSCVLDILILDKGTVKEEQAQGKQLQLFSFESMYRPDAPFHGAALNVTISAKAADFLEANAMKEIPGVHRAMKDHYFAKYPKERKKKDRLHLATELRGVIREYGMVRFTTPEGNCACLGNMPEKRDGCGFEIDSHNLDYSWQQLSMLVGIATMWRWVRRSLNYR